MVCNTTTLLYERVKAMQSIADQDRGAAHIIEWCNWLKKVAYLIGTDAATKPPVRPDDTEKLPRSKEKRVGRVKGARQVKLSKGDRRRFRESYGRN